MNALSVNFKVHPIELEVGTMTMCANAADADPAKNYSLLAERSVAELDREIKNARDLVTTQMLVDGTIAVLRQPAVWARLPLEVSDRTAIAVHCAEMLGRIASESLLFASVFKHSRGLGRLMTAVDLQATQNVEYMQKLGGLAFSDASLAIGGAHRVLKRQRPSEPIADIIARSTGLPAEMSRIAKRHAIRAARRLGFPYVLPRYLKIHTSPSGLPEVILNEEARTFIDAVADPRGGCPATVIGNPYGTGTVLTRAWEEMISVLVPEGATSKLHNIRPRGND